MQYIKKQTISFYRCTPHGVQFFFIKNADLYDLRVELYDLRMLFGKKVVILQCKIE